MKVQALLLVFMLAGCAHVARDASVPTDRIDRALALVEAHYLKPVTRRELEERALRSLLKDLDPYSSYMNADEWAEFQGRFTGSYGGIGVSFSSDQKQGLPVIEYLLVGSSAAVAGVRRGDRLLAIDGVALNGMSMEQVVPRVLGTPGSEIALTVQHAGESTSTVIKVRRKVIVQPSLRGIRRDGNGAMDFMLDAESGIGFIRIMQFGEDTFGLFEAALRELQARGARGLVLDLRDSIGGMANVAIAIADAFLDAGRIISVQNREAEEINDATPGSLTDLPMVMLINQGTASSAEILAGALADNRRALVIGQRTFGKGRVQRRFTLPEGLGGIVLSTGTFQRPSGKTIDRHDAATPDEAGIAPDPGMEIVLDAKEYDAWIERIGRVDASLVLSDDEQRIHDRVLDRAIAELKARIAAAAGGFESAALTDDPSAPAR